MAELKFTRNTVSGKVGYVPADYLTHPVLGKTLEEVPEGTKSRLPEMHAETDVSGKDVSGKQVRDKKVEAPADPNAADPVN